MRTPTLQPVPESAAAAAAATAAATNGGTNGDAATASTNSGAPAAAAPSVANESGGVPAAPAPVAATHAPTSAAPLRGGGDGRDVSDGAVVSSARKSSRVSESEFSALLKFRYSQFVPQWVTYWLIAVTPWDACWSWLFFAQCTTYVCPWYIESNFSFPNQIYSWAYCAVSRKCEFLNWNCFTILPFASSAARRTSRTPWTMYHLRIRSRLNPPGTFKQF